MAKQDINLKSILVVFDQALPKENKKWWQQFERIVGPKSLKMEIKKRGFSFIDIETLISPGSVKEAYEIVNWISQLILPDGSRISKLVNYQGYELWWMHYDSIYYNFCLPYTQYHKLLSYLKDFNKVYLFQPSSPCLFQYFLKANNCECIVLKRFKLGSLLPIPLGTFIQLFLSFIFLFWLKFKKPLIMIRTSDRFNPPRDFDFRQKFIYEELRRNKLLFVEFIRSMESWSTVLRHVWYRKRPVIYSAAIVDVMYHLASRFNSNRNNKWNNPSSLAAINPEERFWFMAAVHYLNNVKGTVWSVRVIEFILRWTGVKTAIIIAGDSRSSHETLGCKLVGIKTTGILHGAGNRYYDVYDFIPEFNAKLPLSVDRYGLWSDWWRDYYISHSRTFNPDQLYVSGPMRPLEKEIIPQKPSFPIKVLFISEDLSDPREIIPYFYALLEVEDLDIYFKFRPCLDSFELRLKKDYPEVHEKILNKTKIFRGTMEEAISQCDVVVGSYSTAVLEALLQLKPLVFFWTDKWQDNFEMRSFSNKAHVFAENPKELISFIRESVNMPRETLKRLQERFFGNPYQNGSKWLVDQAISFL